MLPLGGGKRFSQQYLALNVVIYAATFSVRNKPKKATCPKVKINLYPTVLTCPHRFTIIYLTS